MKHLNTILIVVLGIIVIALHAKDCSGKSESCKNSGNATTDSTKPGEPQDQDNVFPIAYVNVDSLLTNYQYAKDLNEELTKKQNSARESFQKKELQLRSDYAEYQKLIAAYQEKMQTGQILTQETKDKEEGVIKQKQYVIEKKENELKDLDRRLTQDLMADQQKLNSQLRDSINAFFAVYNQDKRYKMILCNTDKDNILYAEDYLNITEDVVKELNKRYKPQGK